MSAPAVLLLEVVAPNSLASSPRTPSRSELLNDLSNSIGGQVGR